MFIASKYVEIEPLTLDLMVNKVAHGKISPAVILKREKTILSSIKFKLSNPTVHEFIECFIEMFQDKFGSDEEKLQIREEAVRVAKNGIADRKTVFGMNDSDNALCCLIIAIKNHGREVKKTILDESFSRAIKSELLADESIVLQFGKRLRKLSIEQIFSLN